jgi:hypothetical protein
VGLSIIKSCDVPELYGDNQSRNTRMMMNVSWFAPDSRVASSMGKFRGCFNPANEEQFLPFGAGA